MVSGIPGYPEVRIRCLYPERAALPSRAFTSCLVSAENRVFGADLLAKLARVTVLARALRLKINHASAAWHSEGFRWSFA